MFCSMDSFSVHGIEAELIAVEVDVGNGMPGFDLVGYLAGEVREARERVQVALRNSGYPLPARRITVNLSPADIRKGGTAYDLPIAIGILCGLEMIPGELTKGCGMIGELGLDGSVRSVPGVLSCVYEAKRLGFQSILVPMENETEGALVDGIQVFGVSSLTDAVNHFNGIGTRPAEQTKWESEDYVTEGDFSDIHGQFMAKRAAEIAVAGMHNLLLTGPPGAGKTMLAERIPGIMPKLEPEESLELTKVYSVAGLLPEESGIVRKRPFRSPHHTASVPALVGGGLFPVPGEVSLASHGVLFLDEFPEFRRGSIEVLRQPLEEKKIHISRLHGNIVFPASFMLVAAMNPCPCGYFPDRNKCRCTPDQIHRYMNRISQPIMDRIDLCVEMPQISVAELNDTVPGECSADIRKRVMQARTRQIQRYADTPYQYNADVPGAVVKKFASMSKEAENVLNQYADERECSARVYHRLIRVARTIADLDDSDSVREEHMQDAIQYRLSDFGNIRGTLYE